jgi:lipopolysaccharide cholinephosphotransferase
MTELEHLQAVLLDMAKYIDELCRKNGIEYHLNGGTAIGAIRHHGFIPWDDDFDIEMTPTNYFRFINVCRQQLDTGKYYLQEGLSSAWPMDSCKLRLLHTRFDEPESYADTEEHRGIYIDIFRIDHGAPTKWGRLWQYVCAKYRLCYLHSRRTYHSASLPKKLLIALAFPQRWAPIRNFFRHQQEKYNNRETDYYGLLTQKTRYPHCFVRRSAVAPTAYVPFADTQFPMPVRYDEYLGTVFGDYMQLPPKEQQQCQHMQKIDFGPYICLLLSMLTLLTACHKDEETVDFTELVQQVPVAQPGQLSFMHVSDTHGQTVTLEKMVPILNAADCQFALLSGDVMATSEIMDLLKQAQKPVFLTPGNHDAYQWGGQKHFRHVALDALSYPDIHFGTDSTNYYYADLTFQGKTLRLISLDQYEVDVMEYHWDEGMLYSQQQIDWFCRVLSESERADGIIIQMHCGFGNKTKGSRDASHQGPFISKWACKYNNSYDYHWNTDATMIPSIVNAYITGVNITGMQMPCGIDNSFLTVNTHFSRPHNNFVGYCGGHLHWDVVEHLSYFTEHPQLQMLVAYAGSGKGNPEYDDLDKSSSESQSYVINYNTVDFDRRTIRIVRLGANKLFDGTTRDSVTYKY